MTHPGTPRPDRRLLLRGLAGLGAAAGLSRAPAAAGRAAPGRGRSAGPAMVASANGLAGMREQWPRLLEGRDPLDCAIGVVKVQEADPSDHSVGLGGLPNEDGVVQLDAACMHGPTHNSGAVAAIEETLHPSEVARLVMERTDHCLLVGPGATAFARMHGHPRHELLTDAARRIWVRWREGLSDRDDRLAPPPNTGADGEEQGAAERDEVELHYGTIHCSALSAAGDVACTTTTSGLSFKVPGRVGDSPIVGAGLYCDEEAGSAGATGRGEAAILANGSFACVELMRGGATPEEAGLEVLRRIVRQTERQARWQPGLLDDEGRPAFNVRFYVLGLDGTCAGVTLRDDGGRYAVADAAGGPRHEPLVALLPA